MALYLVVHSPRDPQDEDGVRPPTRLRDLAAATLSERTSARWLKTWSPDLHDDRIFTMWEANSAADIQRILDEYGFLNDLDAKPMRVREWGPQDVLQESGENANGAPAVG